MLHDNSRNRRELDRGLARFVPGWLLPERLFLIHTGLQPGGQRCQRAAVRVKPRARHSSPWVTT